MAGDEEAGMVVAGESVRDDRRPGEVFGLQRVAGRWKLRGVPVRLAAGANHPARAT
jgi:hypothetical protein